MSGIDLRLMILITVDIGHVIITAQLILQPIQSSKFVDNILLQVLYIIYLMSLSYDYRLLMQNIF
jgi:hypothetical protein